jgi:arylsulfatase A-like enzyme
MQPSTLRFSVALLCVLLMNRALAQSPPPNIVVVFIDDMGWSDLSCFGNRKAQTPNIDRLASEGIRFSQFYVNAPICSPSRCAISTGQYPQRWRITSFLNNRQDNARRGVNDWLDPQAPMLARILRDNGYATGHFGKWHLGGQRDVDNAPAISEYGFDESLTNFEGMGAKLLPLTLRPGQQEPRKIWNDAERLGKPSTWMLRSQITSGFIDAAIPFIDAASKAKKPFYINLWPDDVHSPFWPPVDRWKPGKRSMYLAVLEALDQQLRKLFEHINQSPELRSNTLIALCSDNGPEPGAGSASPLRGNKGQLYEGGIRSPLIVWAPGLIGEERQGFHNETSVIAAFDLPPSLIAITQARSKDGVMFDGEDMSNQLLGKTQESRETPLFWRRPPDRKFQAAKGVTAVPLPDLAVRQDNWKLLCDFDGSKPELYNLADDAEERFNLAAEHADVVARLTKDVLSWNQTMPADKSAELGRQGPPKK